MKQSKLISLLSLFFVLSHFTIIVGVIVFRFIGWYDTKTVKICLPIVVPLFATYTTVILNYLIKKEGAPVQNDKIIDPVLAFIALFIPGIFTLTIGGILYNQGVNPIEKDDLTFFLGLGETLFGVFLGMIVKFIYR